MRAHHVMSVVVLLLLANAAAASPRAAADGRAALLASAAEGGTALLPSGERVTWTTRGVEAAADVEVAVLGADGLLRHVVALTAEIDPERGEVTRFTLFADGVVETADPGSPAQRRRFVERLADLAALAPTLDEIVRVLPEGPARQVVKALSGGTRTFTPGGTGDCYVECIEQQRERCYADCHTQATWHPCVGTCFIAASLGCLIGCS